MDKNSALRAERKLPQSAVLSVKRPWLNIAFGRVSKTVLVFHGQIQQLISVFDFHVADAVLVEFVSDLNFLILIVDPDASIRFIFNVRGIQLFQNFLLTDRMLAAVRSERDTASANGLFFSVFCSLRLIILPFPGADHSRL